MERHPQIVDQRSERVLCEFKCHCEKPYIYVWLNTNMDGNYVVRCPTCGHEHYRTVKGGIISDDRHSYSLNECDVLRPMPSAAQKTPRVRGAIALLREKEAVGLHQ